MVLRYSGEVRPLRWPPALLLYIYIYIYVYIRDTFDIYIYIYIYNIYIYIYMAVFLLLRGLELYQDAALYNPLGPFVAR